MTVTSVEAKMRTNAQMISKCVTAARMIRNTRQTRAILFILPPKHVIAGYERPQAIDTVDRVSVQQPETCFRHIRRYQAVRIDTTCSRPLCGPVRYPQSSPSRGVLGIEPVAKMGRFFYEG